MWGSIDSDSCNKKSQHEYSLHAYIAIVIGLTKQGTTCLPNSAIGDDYMENIVGLFMKSHTVDLGNSLDYLHLLFD